MFGLPLTISRITPTMFLIFFGSGVAIASAGLTSIVWAICRWRYMIKHGDRVLTDYIHHLESKVHGLETERLELSKQNSALSGRLAAAKSVMEL